MIQKIKSKLLIIASALTLLAPVAIPASVAAVANPADNLCSGSNFNIDTNAGGNCGTTDGTSINELLRKIVNVISAIVGVVAVIMIVVGGFKYITSGGDSNNVSGAKNTIIYAIIGLVIVALAQLIVHFVLNQSSNLGGGDGGGEL
jgi:cytochrome bd-type quinol oxidase subunit 2